MLKDVIKISNEKQIDQKTKQTKVNTNNINIDFNNLFSNVLFGDKANLQIKDKDILQIKNNIKSLFKQKNILLTLQEQKEFKSIKSMKELINFANKKGLNIKSFDFKQFDHKIDNQAKGELIKINNKKNDKKAVSFNQFNLNKNIKKINSEKVEAKGLSDFIKLKSNKTTKHQNIDIGKLNKNKEENNNENKLGQILLQQNNQNKEKGNSEIKKGFLENTIDVKNNKSNLINLNTILETKINEKKDEKIDVVNLLNKDKLDVDFNQNIIKDNKVDNLLNIKNRVSSTISNFTDDLKESIKEYKSPISRVSISLNPENLGKVDVTLIKIGDNIKVLMNSHHNTLNVFMQNQQEFKQNLENIGFSNIDMSFNSNSNNSQNQNNHHKNQYINSDVYEENEEIEINVKIYA